MLLHACLLLFIITTDRTLALPPQRCGGHVSLDRGPVGHVSLTVPGPFGDSHGLSATNPLPLCRWTVHVPPGRTLLLKVAGLEGDSKASVRCVRNNTAHNQVLDSTGTALLTGCDGHKAALSWMGAGHSSNVLQLSYYVKEGERNSSEDHTTPDSEEDLPHWSQTGTNSTSHASEKWVRGTEGVRGRLYQGLEWPASGPSSLQPTSPLQGVGVTGRGTLPLPEETPNNGADTSGAARSDGPVSATHPYFPYTDSSHTETNPSDERAQTEAGTFLGTDSYKYTTRLTPKHAGGHKTTQAHASPSGSSDWLSLASSVPALRPLSTWESATMLIPHAAAVSGTPGESRPHSWRSQRSTDGVNSDLTPAITHDPLKSPTEAAWEDSSRAHTYDHRPSSPTNATEPGASSSTVAAGPFHRNTGWFEAATSDASSGAAALEPSGQPDNVVVSLLPSETNSRQSTEELTRSPHAPSEVTQTLAGPDSTRSDVPEANAVPAFAEAEEEEEDDAASTTSASAETATETFTLRPGDTVPQEHPPTGSPAPLLQTSVFPSYTPPTTSGSSNTALASVTTPTTQADDQTEPTSSQATTIKFTPSHAPWLSSTRNPATSEEARGSMTTARSSPSPSTTGDSEVQAEDESGEPFRTSTTTHPPTPPGTTRSLTTLDLSQETSTTIPASTSAPTWSSTSTPAPRFYVVPDQPATVKVETIELLLQMIVEESRSAFAAGLEEDTTAWMEPYLQKAPGFSRMLGVWSSGRAVQSLVEFRTSGALEWLGETGPTSLLERTGLAQAVREGRWFRASKVTNVTLGGVQGDVCDWLLQCPSGYRCVSRPGVANCSSVCRFDHCHNHGICTHHPGQLPVCRCLVGEDFWYMGQRCDVRMTRARLVGACLAIMLILVAVISILAFLAVRRYRAILIQAKVDQTRSSYRRFNHFDELSGRFWLRSWAGSADSMDNPAFTRSDELLHLRALDRPCCYHDDTLSLASTCPSHGTHINTIYPHSSQYAWRGSEMSMGDGVLDSGKASDLSVCSWPVEPIHWTPFPLLQQLASHRTPTLRVSRPRSYCEGMELVDLGRSWTA